MQKLIQKISRFIVRTDGPTAVEYAVLLALLVGMMISGITYVGDEAKEISNVIETELDSALNN